mgnify:CR=1 FL=1
MSNRDDWDCEISEQNRYEIVWDCTNTESGETKKITSKLSKEKTFPEENYTFEGHIDGKEVEGTLTTGTSPFKMISAKEFDVKLSPVEKVVGLAHMESHF